MPNTGVARNPRDVTIVASRSPIAAATSQPATAAVISASPSLPSRSATASTAGSTHDPTWVRAAMLVSSCARVCMRAPFANAASSARTRAPSHSSVLSSPLPRRAKSQSGGPAAWAASAQATLCSRLLRCFWTTASGMSASVRVALKSDS